MKRTTLFFCLLLPYLIQAQIKFDSVDLSAIVNGEKHASAGRFVNRFPETQSDIDVKAYRCIWNINPAVKMISGNVTIFFNPKTAIDSLILNLSGFLTVDSVISKNHPLAWYHAADLLVMHFPSIISPQDNDSATIYYHGVPPDFGFDTFVQATHQDAPIIWTLSEPYGASDWWPCKNDLTDKADSVDIFIRTPVAYKAASNGVLISESREGDEMIYHWKHRYPIAAYLVCLAVTNFSRYTEMVPYGSDTLHVVNYVYPEDSAAAVSQTGEVIPMIQLFDSLFGIYPFQREKYGHAQFGWGGGMEHQTMTFVTNFQFELLAHELAHQWFGDKITCGSWTDIWLNEGFATYLSGLCYEFLSPGFWKRFREVRVRSIISRPGGSVYCSDTTNIDRIFDGRLSYAKGSMILHQIRWIIGDQAFFTALNNYLEDVTLSYGFARTENLKSHFERTSGMDLTWYFNDWFTGEGYPSYQIGWQQLGDTVTFTVHQTQSDPSVSFFELPLELAFKNEIQDTLIRFENTYSGQTFRVLIPFKIDSLIFDPRCQIISGNNMVNSMTEREKGIFLQSFPNPARTKVIFLRGEAYSGVEAKLSIFNSSACLLSEFTFIPGQTEFVFNTWNFPSGLYFYVFRQQNFQQSGKMLVE